LPAGASRANLAFKAVKNDPIGAGVAQKAVLELTQADAVRETLVEFPDNRLLIDLCGGFDANLAAVEEGFGVQILRRGNLLAIHGPKDARATAEGALRGLYRRLEEGRPVEPGDVDAAIRMATSPAPEPAAGLSPGQLELFAGGRVEIRTQKKVVEPRTAAQRAYVQALFKREMVFGVGPAGTGKTYLAVAAAVSMFLEGRVDKIILSRPAVEAGERLGFLPGDMKEKVDPYLRPLYDSLNDLIPGKQVARYMEDGRIEVAPLAFMRGRTLANAFVVLDEAQNCTEMQMKMFLTRMGEGSRMAITGDPTQIDLPPGTRSGLKQALALLRDVKGVDTVRFTAKDVVRHPLVARIIEAYDGAQARARAEADPEDSMEEGRDSAG
jgi:phosphate starvation-inducible PhoH-like protein